MFDEADQFIDFWDGFDAHATSPMLIQHKRATKVVVQFDWFVRPQCLGMSYICLLYTSDAADEEDSVDLGGRRIIKKNLNSQSIA